MHEDITEATEKAVMTQKDIIAIPVTVAMITEVFIVLLTKAGMIRKAIIAVSVRADMMVKAITNQTVGGIIHLSKRKEENYGRRTQMF